MSNLSQNFWEFSLDLYSSTEISTACLDLQNKYGVDVNLLLLCCWSGTCVGELSEDSLSKALNYSKQWREQVVSPLRQTRRWMKSNMPADQNQQISFHEVRDEIKAVELRAEKHQQSVLEQIVMSQSNSGAGLSPEKAIRENVFKLLKQMKVAEDSELRATLSLVINAAVAN